jgi:hypothetical protein
MKTLITALALLLCGLCTSLSAQIFGVKAGVNIADVDVSGEEGDLYKSKIGFHAGITAEFPLNPNWSFETGALLSNKGINAEFSILGTDFSILMDPYYIDIPILIKRYINVGAGKLFVTLGPTTSIGVAGNVVASVTAEGQTESDKMPIEWGSSSTDNLRRYAYSAQAGLGFQMRGIEVGASYQYGFTNSLPLSDDDSSLKHRVIQVSVGYRFGVKPVEEVEEVE